MTQGQGWGPPPGSQSPGGQAPGGQAPGTPPPLGSPPPHWAPPPPPGPPSKYCYACGSAIDSRSVDCPRCGVRQPDAYGGSGKNRAGAALLAIIVGGLGIHRFYLGDIAWGVVYLLFSWTGIPSIIAWFEALYFLTRSDAQWAAVHGGPVRPADGLGIGCAWFLLLWPLIFLVGAIVMLGGLLLFAPVSSIVSGA